MSHVFSALVLRIGLYETWQLPLTLAMAALAIVVARYPENLLAKLEAFIGAIASSLGPTDAPGILLAVLLATAVMAASLASLDRLANRSLQIVFSVALSLLAGAYLLIAGWIQSRLGLPPVGWTNDLAIPITLLALLGVTLGALALISDRDIAPLRSISDRLWVAAANVGVNDRLSSRAVGGTA